MGTTAANSPTVDFRSRLDSSLNTIQTPSLYDCAWIAPFEQLVGAAYSLIESEKRDYSHRGHSLVYHPAVQGKIVSLLAELDAGGVSTDKEALEEWLSRYYFNSGIQRLNFAAERLAVTFAILRCSCGGRTPPIAIGTRVTFKVKLERAKSQVAHVESEYSGSLAKVKEVIKQLETYYERSDSFDPSKGLAMIRQDVNNRKHSPYERSATLDSLPTSSSGTVTWANAGFKKKMAIAVTSLELVVGAYTESLAWFPLAKL